MDDYRDPTGITRAATIAVLIYMVLDVVGAVARFTLRDPGGLSDMLSIPTFVGIIVCFFVVGRWIYVTNANAHAFGTGEMTISPGWAVGWFFIPIANLFKPYEAMKETWRVSHQFGGLLEDAESGLPPLWWGLWIVTNIVGWVGIQLGGASETPLEGFYVFDMLAAALNVGLCLVLVRLMGRLAHAQRLARHAGVFA
ncbi:MAG: DUF4328 domain-containing protein [Sphingosinicella sp.]|uniref:DUF4328 domain-containing protein n=1 Tax=Sphingosinicella sp. TaxID=1917971 RepID=UPI00403770E0